MNEEPKEYYTPPELAEKLNLALKTIRKWTYERRIPGQIKVGSLWRYRALEIEKALLRRAFLNK